MRGNENFSHDLDEMYRPSERFQMLARIVTERLIGQQGIKGQDGETSVEWHSYDQGHYFVLQSIETSDNYEWFLDFHRIEDDGIHSRTYYVGQDSDYQIRQLDLSGNIIDDPSANASAAQYALSALTQRFPYKAEVQLKDRYKEDYWKLVGELIIDKADIKDDLVRTADIVDSPHRHKALVTLADQAIASFYDDIKSIIQDEKIISDRRTYTELGQAVLHGSHFITDDYIAGVDHAVEIFMHDHSTHQKTSLKPLQSKIAILQESIADTRREFNAFMASLNPMNFVSGYKGGRDE